MAWVRKKEGGREEGKRKEAGLETRRREKGKRKEARLETTRKRQDWNKEEVKRRSDVQHAANSYAGGGRKVSEEKAVDHSGGEECFSNLSMRWLTSNGSWR